ncbi:MAG: hypothetical protein K9W42_06535 [Candidatus Heimdallarchaeota archaeon]|nr:hypothetical protein [Candidatus Heimdallarchaeota archaeon]
MSDEQLHWKTWEGGLYRPLTYVALSLPESLQEYFGARNASYFTYCDISTDLLPASILKEKKKKYLPALQWTCHLDPDLLPAFWNGQLAGEVFLVKVVKQILI